MCLTVDSSRDLAVPAPNESERWLACSLGQYLLRRYAVLAAMQRGGAISWKVAAQTFAGEGLRDPDGNVVTEQTIQLAWQFVVIAKLGPANDDTASGS